MCVSKSDDNQKVNNLQNKVNEQFTLLGQLSDEKLIGKNNNIKEMITYYNKLTSEMEQRRGNIFVISLALIPIAISMIGFVLLKNEIFSKDYYIKFFIKHTLIEQVDLVIFFSILIIALLCLFFSLCIGIKYQFQSSYRYPFCQVNVIGNQWKWFYYGNEFIQRIDTSLSKKIKDNLNLIEYLNGLVLFCEKYTSEDLRSEVKGNIIQLYLLQVHNYYKNKFYLQLVNYLKLLFKITIGIIIICFFSVTCLIILNCWH